MIPPMTIARMIGSIFFGYVITRVFVVPDADWDDEREIRMTIDALMHGLTPTRG